MSFIFDRIASPSSTPPPRRLLHRTCLCATSFSSTCLSIRLSIHTFKYMHVRTRIIKASTNLYPAVSSEQSYPGGCRRCALVLDGTLALGPEAAHAAGDCYDLLLRT